MLSVGIRKLLFVQANTESAFAGLGVVSLTDKAERILYLSRGLIEVRDLLHEVFIELMVSCGKKHGPFRSY